MTRADAWPNAEVESKPQQNRRRPDEPASLDPLAELEQDAGLFSRQSIIRRVNSEALTLLGGGRAILLQLAHPLVAAGVNDASRFQSDPLARLFRTLDLMHTLVFDEPRRVRSAVQRYHQVHARIQGELPQAAGCFPAGTRYTAGDPHLKLWVFATLVDTSLITYQRFVAPLSPAERSSYYADTLVLARLLDIPHELLPPSLDAFQGYMQTMLASDRLAVTDTSRRLARDVLAPRNVGRRQYACARLLRFVTAGLLPERLRTAYGLPWRTRGRLTLDGLSRTTRGIRPVAPVWLWRSPQLEGPSLLRSLLWPSAQRNRSTNA